MPHDSRSANRYVLGDWGTSRLRMYLIEAGVIVGRREGPGIGSLPGGGVDEALSGAVSEWIEGSQTLEVVLCGMVGSRNGLLETSYVRLPADCAKWSEAAASLHRGPIRVTIASGLFASLDPCDVMRGEETQVFGAMQLDPTLASGTHLFVLPGTHSKWVRVHDGTVVSFRTVITGELFALLCDHSTLLRVAVNAPDGPTDKDLGFAAGLERSKRTPKEGVLPALFETRTAQLLLNRSARWARGFLSGLLIGHEVASMSALYDEADVLKIVGEAPLVALYEQVFAARGVQTRTFDGGACAIAGLELIRQRRT